MVRHRTVIYATLFVLFLVAGYSSLQAQSATATLSGTAIDQSGAAVPGVEVTIINSGTGMLRKTVSSGEGAFIFPLLPPGQYKVTAQRDGFTPTEIRSVVLNVGDQVSISIQLKVGQVSTAINVTDETPLINQSPAVATTINRQFVGNLPLNGRSFQSLILLTPGVTVSSNTYDPGQFSVNGQRANANYFTVDGVSANIGFNNYAQSGSVPGLSAFGGTNNLVSIDALEEFRIQTSTYTAEFGRQPGGQVSLVTRSGTNQFHGTLFEYLRNEVMDARDYFNKIPAKKPPLRQNQFGGTFSGPIVLPGIYDGHNRTFFFFSYEGQRLRLPISGIVNMPSLRLRNLATAAKSTVVPILNAFPLPASTTPELVGTTGVPLGFTPYNYSISNPSTMNATSIRIDHTLSSKLTLFGRFNESPSSSMTRNASSLTTPAVTAASTRTVTLGATQALTLRLSNELRINYSRQRSRSYYVMDALGGAVSIDVSALTSGYSGSGLKVGLAYILLGSLNSSLSLGDTADSYQRQINVVDNVSLMRGSHQFKFGIDYRRLAPIYGTREYQPTAFFRSEANIISGTVSLLSIAAFQGARPLFDNFSAYGQDTWKLSPRLTLDLGIRWELNPAPHEATGKKPAIAIGVDNLPTATLAPPDAPFYKTVYTAFAPRVGAAYQLKQASGWETVLRGGFGVYYDLGSGQATSAFVNGLPFSVSSPTLVNVPYPVPPASAAPPAFPEVKLPITGAVYSLDPDLKLPYTLQWNIALEQSLGAQQSVSLSYVASAARRLLMQQMLNAPAGYTTGPRPNPNFNVIWFGSNGPTADYQSLQAQYKARLRRGLQALVNYTWSHAIDEISDEVTGYNLDRGNANFDVRHNFSAAATYNLPMPHAGPVIAGIFGKWSLDCVVHAQSGRPVNVTGTYFVREGEVATVRPDVVPGTPFYIDDPTVPGGRRFNAAAFTAPPSNPAYPTTPARQGTLGRNVLRELPLYQADVAMGRSFNFSENLKLQFKAEAFNVFNHPMFGNYGVSYTSPSTFGVPTTTLGRALGGLSSLYQIGGPRSIQLSLKLSF